MGVSKSTQDQSGFEYAMAVMKQVSKQTKEKDIENYLHIQFIPACCKIHILNYIDIFIQSVASLFS